MFSIRFHFQKGGNKKNTGSKALCVHKQRESGGGGVERERESQTDRQTERKRVIQRQTDKTDRGGQRDRAKD